MATYPEWVGSATWIPGDEMTWLDKAVNWYYFSIWLPLSSQATNMKHFDIIVQCLQWLEPVDVSQRMRVVIKMGR